MIVLPGSAFATFRITSIVCGCDLTQVIVTALAANASEAPFRQDGTLRDRRLGLLGVSVQDGYRSARFIWARALALPMVPSPITETSVIPIAPSSGASRRWLRAVCHLCDRKTRRRSNLDRPGRNGPGSLPLPDVKLGLDAGMRRTELSAA